MTTHKKEDIKICKSQGNGWHIVYEGENGIEGYMHKNGSWQKFCGGENFHKTKKSAQDLVEKSSGREFNLQEEINRLRRVLRDIADSRPDQHMDIEKGPELVNWICGTCHRASIGAYPSDDNKGQK